MYGGSLASVHLHMNPPMFSFMPAYHYDSGMGLTLYHHQHYVHYSVMDLVLRAILSVIFMVVILYLICYLISLCQKSSEADYDNEVAY